MMKKISTYLADSYFEITREVTWPTSQVLQQSTMIVLSATLLVTAIVWVMDSGAAALFKSIYSIIK